MEFLSTNGEKSITTIPVKLESPSNWDTYKFHVVSSAVAIDALDILNGQSTRPTASASTTASASATSTDAVKTFDRKNSLLYSAIARSIGSVGISVLQTANVTPGDGHAAFKALSKYYESDTMAAIRQDVEKFINLRQDSDSVVEFVAKVEQLKARISTATTQHQIDLLDVLASSVVIAGLNTKYNNLKQPLFLDSSNFPTLKTKIIEQCQRIDIMEPSSGKGSALSASHMDPTKSVKCKHCGKSNHPSNKCYKKFPQLRTSSSGDSSSSKKSASEPDNHKCWSVHRVLSTKSSEPNPSKLVFEVDSGSTDHTVRRSDSHALMYTDYSSSLNLTVANGDVVSSLGSGYLPGKFNAEIHIMPDEKWSTNLLSVAQLYQENIATIFMPGKGVIISRASDVNLEVKETLASGSFKQGIFEVSIRTDNLDTPQKPVAHSTKLTAALPRLERAKLFFKRTGYQNPDRLLELGKQAIRNGLISELSITDFSFVASDETYKLVRTKAHPHHDLKGIKRSDAPFSRIAIDLKVSVGAPTFTGCTHLLIIVDDYTRWKEAIPLRQKSDLVDALTRWHDTFVVPLGHKTSFIRCDNAGEQISHKFNKFIQDLKAKVEYTNAYSSASNGMAERGIGTIWTTAQALRIGAKLPRAFWGECARTAAFIENRLPTSANPESKSPFELLYKRKPDLSVLRVIGSRAFVHDHKPETALSPASKEGILIGYATSTNGYRIVLDIKAGNVIETAHVTFIESTDNSPRSLIRTLPGPTEEYLIVPRTGANAAGGPSPPSPTSAPTTPSAPTSIPTPPPVPTSRGASTTAEDNPQTDHLLLSDDAADLLEGPLQETIATSRPTRAIRAPVRFDPSDPSSFTSSHHANMVKKKIGSKISYEQAVAIPELAKAMADEAMTILTNGSTKIVDIQPGDVLIKSTWAHRLPTDHKPARSRICPQGFMQIPGLHYDPDAVSSPTPSLDIINIALGIEVKRSQQSKLIDVSKAFANYAVNNHRVLMDWPAGIKKIPGKALLLVNSLQGTKQGAHDWFLQVIKFLESIGFRQSISEPCYFYKWIEGRFCQIVVWVDDFRVMCDSPEDLESICQAMSQRFKTTTGDANRWIGLNIVHDRDRGKLTISSSDYVEQLLKQFDFLDCKPISTPAEPNKRLSKAHINEFTADVKNFDYRSLVGQLLWLARTARPDILYAVSQLTQHCQLWNSSHIAAGKRILRYLKGTSHLLFTRHKKNSDSYVVLNCFSDADFAAEPEGNDHPMRSLSGQVVYMEGIGVISCSSILEKTLSVSTAESEYKAIYNGAKAITGYRQFLEEIGFDQSEPSIIFNDNAAANAMVKQEFSSSKTRHIQIRFHYIKEKVKEGTIKVKYCPTNLMVADIMTKALDRVKFEKFRDALLSGELTLNE